MQGHRQQKIRNKAYELASEMSRQKYRRKGKEYIKIIVQPQEKKVM